MPNPSSSLSKEPHDFATITCTHREPVDGVRSFPFAFLARTGRTWRLATHSGSQPWPRRHPLWWFRRFQLSKIPFQSLSDFDARSQDMSNQSTSRQTTFARSLDGRGAGRPTDVRSVRVNLRRGPTRRWSGLGGVWDGVRSRTLRSRMSGEVVAKFVPRDVLSFGSPDTDEDAPRCDELLHPVITEMK
jgi:hypothetical protein